jgi:putative flippase GtrA
VDKLHKVLGRQVFVSVRCAYARFYFRAFRLGRWAAALAIEGSTINNFLWNNFWTFHRSRTREIFRTIGRFFAFNLLSVGGIPIQFCTEGIAVRLFGRTPAVRQITLILTIIFLVMPYNWLSYTRLMWRRQGSEARP